MSADDFRSAMDNDKAFQSKRKALVFTSLLLLALVVSGAQIKEANTFIFKIEFLNHEGLRCLLVISVMACMLRYYSYSERYYAQLFDFWSTRMLSDSDIYYLDQEAGQISGVLGKKVYLDYGRYDMERPVYKKTGFSKRSVGLPTSEVHDFHGEIFYKKYFSLNDCSSAWKPKDFRKLLLIELKYRVEALVRYRETLDLISPYFLGVGSLLAFIISLFLV